MIEFVQPFLLLKTVSKTEETHSAEQLHTVFCQKVSKNYASQNKITCPICSLWECERKPPK